MNKNSQSMNNNSQLMNKNNQLINKNRQLMNKNRQLINIQIFCPKIMMFLNKSLSIICQRHFLQQYLNVFRMKEKLVVYIISYFKNKILMKFKMINNIIKKLNKICQNIKMD